MGLEFRQRLEGGRGQLSQPAESCPGKGLRHQLGRRPSLSQSGRPRMLGVQTVASPDIGLIESTGRRCMLWGPDG